MTPDNAGQTVLEALDALIAEASPLPWLAGYQGEGNDVWAKQPEEHWHDADLVFVEARPRGSHRPANAALTVHAVNHLRPLVAALEGTIDDTEMLLEGCIAAKRDDDNEEQERDQAQADVLRCVMGFFREHGGPEALAALQRDIEEA